MNEKIQTISKKVDFITEKVMIIPRCIENIIDKQLSLLANFAAWVNKISAKFNCLLITVFSLMLAIISTSNTLPIIATSIAKTVAE